MENTNLYSLAGLDRIVQGQAERNVMATSKNEYLGRLNTMCKLIFENTELRSSALENDGNGNFYKHTGDADKLYKLQLPMAVSTARYLFAMISINPNLARRKKRNLEEAGIDNNDDSNDANDGNGKTSSTDPAAEIITVTSQTYQNYKSALKWWHAYDCQSMDKIGYSWPIEVDEALKKAIATYKRDVAMKKRRGIMRNKEGKYPYDLSGYIELNRHFNMIKPEGQFKTWSEGIFAGLFTDLSVHTIGRSDNIDDVLFTNMSWDNDALTISFGRYKL
jgi:hypothetical protein